MTKIELGPVGVAFEAGDGDGSVRAAEELERLGYPTLWTGGGQLGDIGQIAAMVRATAHARVATGILSVDRFPADDVAALYTDLERTHPGRFVVGLGGAHGPDPFGTLNAYLDRLDATVPASVRIMAALGPRMLDLARRRAAGAYPTLVTREYTAGLRGRLGENTTLAVMQMAVVETDAGRARTLMREGPLGFLAQVPAYQANFRRMGFTDEDIDGRSDRLVDALVAWGDVDTIAARVAAQRDAGADHVAVRVVSPDALPIDAWRRLAPALLARSP
jgi:probable F420-dependent oxidoreductase